MRSPKTELTHYVRSRLRDYFYRQNEDFQVALYLLILLNLNEDEVSGIKWDDIDFQKDKFV